MMMSANQRPLTTAEEALFRDLKAHAAHRSTGNGYLKCSRLQFILDFGWWYEPAPLPEGISRAAPNECYKNALELAEAIDGLIYVEGVVVGDGGLLVPHAWATDDKGHVLDPTLEPLGLAYAGVPLITSFVAGRASDYGFHVPMLDDWEHDWPLLRELFDRPDIWYESRAVGFRKLQ
jgi:hypothetical protein